VAAGENESIGGLIVIQPACCALIMAELNQGTLMDVAFRVFRT
jgi:hypothetical protein